MNCGKFYDAQYVKKSEGVPKCSCGGVVKPDVVLYEEGLDEETIRGAVEAIASADMLLIGGTFNFKIGLEILAETTRLSATSTITVRSINKIIKYRTSIIPCINAE